MNPNTAKFRKDLALLGLLVASGTAFAQPKPTPAPMDCRARTVEESRIELCRSKGEPQFGDVYVLRADGKLVFVVAAEYIHRVELELVTVTSRVPVLQRLSGQGDKVAITGGCLPEGGSGATKAQVCNFYWGKHQVVKDERFEVR